MRGGAARAYDAAGMNRIARTRSLLVLLAAAASLAPGCGRGPGTGPAWGVSLREALREAESSRRPVMVLLVNEWDPWCRRLESESLRDPAAAAALEGYLRVRVDVEREPGIPARLNVLFLPSLVALDYRGEELFRLTGFHNARQLAAAVEAHRPGRSAP